jgi:hypothetical protein
MDQLIAYFSHIPSSHRSAILFGGIDTYTNDQHTNSIKIPFARDFRFKQPNASPKSVIK